MSSAWGTTSLFGRPIGRGRVPPGSRSRVVFSDHFAPRSLFTPVLGGGGGGVDQTGTEERRVSVRAALAAQSLVVGAEGLPVRRAGHRGGGPLDGGGHR